MLYIRNLDGIRALAVLIVLISHTGFGHIVPGGFGVTVFFFLSGFLITSLLAREFQKTRSINFRRFIFRRALRIFVPLYIVYFSLLLFATLGIYPSEYTLSGVLSQLAFLTNYYVIYFGESGIVDGTGMLWSLGVEEHYYLIFPALFLLLSRKGTTYVVLGLVAICLCVLFWRVYLSQFSFSEDRFYLATDTRIDSIIYGALLASFMTSKDAFVSKRKISWSQVALFSVAVAALLFTFMYRDLVFRNVYRYSIQGLALMPCFYFMVTRPDLIVFRWLEWPILKKIGLFSYMIYLIHSPVVHIFTTAGIEKGYVLLVLTLLISISISALSYKYVESPILKLKYRLT